MRAGVEETGGRRRRYVQDIQGNSRKTPSAACESDGSRFNSFRCRSEQTNKTAGSIEKAYRTRSKTKRSTERGIMRALKTTQQVVAETQQHTLESVNELDQRNSDDFRFTVTSLQQGATTPSPYSLNQGKLENYDTLATSAASTTPSSNSSSQGERDTLTGKLDQYPQYKLRIKSLPRDPDEDNAQMGRRLFQFAQWNIIHSSVANILTGYDSRWSRLAKPKISMMDVDAILAKLPNV
ncbi:hypothetical protein DFS34DRAFT_681945, partial [Phlyctochytrium arcticum]